MEAAGVTKEDYLQIKYIINVFLSDNRMTVIDILKNQEDNDGYMQVKDVVAKMPPREVEINIDQAVAIYLRELNDRGFLDKKVYPGKRGSYYKLNSKRYEAIENVLSKFKKVLEWES